MNYPQGNRRLGLMLAGTLAAVGMLPAAAMATSTLNGSGNMSYAYQALAPSGSEVGGTNDYILAVPGKYSFVDTALSNLGAATPLGTSSVGSYDFQDSYRFTVSVDAGGNTLVASLGLGDLYSITNLQFRLYEVPTPTTAAVVGAIPTGDRVVSPWIGQSGVANSGTTITGSFSNIQAGTYILDVAGIASGTGGGSYVGSLNLAPLTVNPVPLPAAAWLLLSGLAGLGAVVRKRKAA